MSSPDTPLPADELATMFGFTLDELALNRAGQFSARQRQNLRFRSARMFVCGLALFLMSTITMITLYQIVSRRGWWALLVATIFLQIALLLALARLVLRPPVHTATGPIRRGTDAWKPSIIVDDTLVLRISTRRWKRLPESLPGVYQVYYGPDRRVLSLEPEEESGA